MSEAGQSLWRKYEQVLLLWVGYNSPFKREYDISCTMPGFQFHTDPLCSFRNTECLYIGDNLWQLSQKWDKHRSISDCADYWLVIGYYSLDLPLCSMMKAVTMKIMKPMMAVWSVVMEALLFSKRVSVNEISIQTRHYFFIYW